MKRMLRRPAFVTLALVLLLTLFPGVTLPALAAGDAIVTIGGAAPGEAGWPEDATWDAGTYTLTLPAAPVYSNAQIIFDCDKNDDVTIILLSDYNIQCRADETMNDGSPKDTSAIYCAGNLTIKGNGNLWSGVIDWGYNKNTYGIYVVGDFTISNNFDIAAIGRCGVFTGGDVIIHTKLGAYAKSTILTIHFMEFALRVILS